MTEKLTAKKFTMNILNGAAIGIILALIPGALLGELFKALLPVFPAGQFVLNLTDMANSMLGLIVGVLIGFQFKFPPIQTASLGLAVMVGGGAVDYTGEAFLISGTGDVINMMFTGAIGAGIILLFGTRLKSYSIILIPPILLVVGGGLGYALLPYVGHITELIGSFVSQILTLQPILMSVLIAIVFSILITTPITTVGIALAVSLAGIGSGAGNLGVVAAGFGLAIAGWRVNTVGTSLAHFIGSPKMSMPNVFAKPKILLPIICNAAVLGVLAALFKIQGTPMSAGFGFSGLIGPVNNLNLAAGGWSAVNILVTLVVFVAAPIGLGLFFNYLFTRVWPIISPEDYKLDVE